MATGSLSPEHEWFLLLAMFPRSSVTDILQGPWKFLLQEGPYPSQTLEQGVTATGVIQQPRGSMVNSGLALVRSL